MKTEARSTGAIPGRRAEHPHGKPASRSPGACGGCVSSRRGVDRIWLPRGSSWRPRDVHYSIPSVRLENAASHTRQGISMLVSHAGVLLGGPDRDGRFASVFIDDGYTNSLFLLHPK